jgi:DNA-binding transcriptional ArsR family regulator
LGLAGDAVIEPARACTVLAAMRDAEEAGAPLSTAELAGRLGITGRAATQTLELLYEAGLVLAEFDGQTPLLLTAGRQYLLLGGEVEEEALMFLPRVIDDLTARAALLAGGTLLVDGFRVAVLEGRTFEHAAELVPPAFATAISEQDAVDLFACAVALVARLSCGQPAGCVGEELMAVALMAEAASWIETERERGRFSDDDADSAANELRALFELFQDDDILDLFDMREPADAAVAGHLPRNEQLGIVDQRLEAWFVAFDGTPTTGHLRPAGETRRYQ